MGKQPTENHVVGSMTERPIIFSAPMVRALLAGQKTQTRRAVSQANSFFGSANRRYWAHGDFARAHVDGTHSDSWYLHVPAHDGPCSDCDHWGWPGTSHRLWPRIAPAHEWVQATDGDYRPPASRLWVREGVRWEGGPRAIYQADGAPCVIDHWVWQRPALTAIYLPRGAARIVLAVESVRIERVQEISAEDAVAEGIERSPTSRLK